MQTDPGASRSRAVLLVHRLLLQARGRRARRLVELAHLGAARAAGRYLTGGEPGGTYLRGGLGGPDFVPGLSDVDLAVVLADEPAARRARSRWLRLRRALPPVELLVDWPRVYSAAELRGLAGATTYTYGGTVYDDPAVVSDALRALERPGLHGTTAGWVLLAGRDLRPPARRLDRQERRLTAWLELVYWWRLIVPFCVDPTLPRAADVAVKLVAEPARIWLWLAHEERAESRVDALERLARRLPEEEEPARRALALRRALPERPVAPLDELLPAAARLSERIARLVTAESREEGVREVRLTGVDRAGPGVPLADWRAIVCPDRADERIVPSTGSPGDPSAVAAAASAPQLTVLRSGDLVVMPTLGLREARLRAVECPAADPAAFALLDGEDTAAFPETRGWSALDTARRAVAEHRARLASSSDPALLLTAARAALFLESVERGAPELCVSAAEAGRRLGAEDPGELRRLVLALPAYQAGDPLHD